MVHGEDQIWRYLVTKKIINGEKITVYNYGNHSRFYICRNVVNGITKIIKKFQNQKI